MLRYRAKWNCGYSKGRRRGHAIIIQQCVSLRLSRAKVSHAKFLYDMRNAFWGAPESSVVQAVVRALRHPFDDIFASHVKCLALYKQCHHEPSIVVHPAFGAPPGGTFFRRRVSRELKPYC